MNDSNKLNFSTTLSETKFFLEKNLHATDVVAGAQGNGRERGGGLKTQEKRGGGVVDYIKGRMRSTKRNDDESP